MIAPVTGSSEAVSVGVVVENVPPPERMGLERPRPPADAAV
jgi:hypothetical protein